MNVVSAAIGLSEGAIVGDDFRILRHLGSGGMGVVYVAEQLSTGRQRALKVMHQHYARDPKQRERFVREARVGALIDSRHIVDVVAAGITDGMPWIAMELLNGLDLAEFLGLTGGLPFEMALPVVEQICDAIGAAHEAGVVHRDIKPENMFVAKPDKDGRQWVKVLDFGIARLAADARSGSTTVIGSPAWMAPEQADPEEPITPATDVWAIGLLVFSILTGRFYWKSVDRNDGSLHAVMKEVLFDPLVAPSKRAAELGCDVTFPKGFDAWYDRCVHREARARFANAREAWDALRACFPSEVHQAVPLPIVAGTATKQAAPLSTRSYVRRSDLAIDGPLSLSSEQDGDSLSQADANGADTIQNRPSFDGAPDADAQREEESQPAPVAQRDGAAAAHKPTNRFSLAVLAVAAFAVALWFITRETTQETAPTSREVASVPEGTPPFSSPPSTTSPTEPTASAPRDRVALPASASAAAASATAASASAPHLPSLPPRVGRPPPRSPSSTWTPPRAAFGPPRVSPGRCAAPREAKSRSRPPSCFATTGPPTS